MGPSRCAVAIACATVLNLACRATETSNGWTSVGAVDGSSGALPLAFAAASSPQEANVPRATGCVWASDHWSGERVALDVLPGRLRFAHATSGRVRLAALAEGGAQARIETRTLDVHGFVDAAQAIVRPSRPIAFGGYAIAGPKARLSLLRSPGSDRQVVAWPAVFRQVGDDAGPQAEIACTDATLDVAAFDVTRGMPPEKPLRRAYLDAGDTISLALGQTGPPVVAVKLGQREPEVLVLAQGRERTRVVWVRDDGVIFGWVPSSAIRSQRDLAGQFMEDVTSGPLMKLAPGGICGFAAMGGAPSNSAPPPPPPPAPREVTCDLDVPIVVGEAGKDAAPERYFVGSARAGTTLRISAAGDTLPHVTFPGPSDISLEPFGADYFVRARDVSECRSVRAQKGI